MPHYLLRAVNLLGIAAITIFLNASAAHACSRSGIGTSASQVILTNSLDQSLFNKAVLAEVNFVRCKAGVQPLKLARGLIKVANTHATWMAKRRTLSHQSTVRGQQSVQERVIASGINARRGSENIGNTPRYNFSGARRIRVNNLSQCDFSTAGGRPVSPHSYASLASQIVDMWMDSKGHRKNVLDQNVSSVGSAIEFDPRASHCGQFFLSQNFAG